MLSVADLGKGRHTLGQAPHHLLLGQGQGRPQRVQGSLFTFSLPAFHMLFSPLLWVFTLAPLFFSVVPPPVLGQRCDPMMSLC